MMKICIVGWYFRESFFEAVRQSGYEAFVVKHREGDTRRIPSALYPNLGLEFGAYRQYIENHWDGVSDVFFCHDDTEITGHSALHQVYELNGIGVEQAYVFPDEVHEFANAGMHGRGIWIRGDVLAKLREDFPADMDNGGVNIGVQAQKGILAFHKRILECGSNTGVIAIVPQFTFGRRGRIHQEMFVYRKTGPVPGGLVSV